MALNVYTADTVNGVVRYVGFDFGVVGVGPDYNR